MHVDAIGMSAACFNDMPYEEAYPHALKLAHHSGVSFKDVVTQAAYETIPVSYIFTEKDLIVSPELQNKYIALLEENGRKVDVRKLDAGHCPTVSCPDKFVETIVQIAGLA